MATKYKQSGFKGTVSKAGRRKIINVPASNKEIIPGNFVEVKKVKK